LVLVLVLIGLGLVVSGLGLGLGLELCGLVNITGQSLPQKEERDTPITTLNPDSRGLRLHTCEVYILECM